MLVWPLLSRVIAMVRPPKPKEFAEEQPVD